MITPQEQAAYAEIQKALPKLGTGQRFANLEAQGISPALAATIGRKKYGKKKFQALSKAMDGSETPQTKPRQNQNPGAEQSQENDDEAAELEDGTAATEVKTVATVHVPIAPMRTAKSVVEEAVKAYDESKHPRNKGKFASKGVSYSESLARAHSRRMTKEGGMAAADTGRTYKNGNPIHFGHHVTVPLKSWKGGKPFTQRHHGVVIGSPPRSDEVTVHVYHTGQLAHSSIPYNFPAKHLTHKG
jgi:hypothetical protein